MGGTYDPLASVQAAGPPGTTSFTYGLPDPATFPAVELRDAALRVLSERPTVALQYGPEQGYGPLIDFLRARFAREEGLAVERPQIMLTSGSAGALDLICTLLTRPGGRVLVEAPTYHETLQLFRDHGLVPLQVATDGSGLDIGSLSDRLQALATQGTPARFVYTIPNFQNPSGITLPLERRRAVLALAQEHDLLVVEDDVYRDLAYEGSVPPSFFALDGGRRVLRTGSFSKILAPALRLGWLLAPPRLIERLLGSGLLNIGGGANPLVANIVAEYCGAGHLEPHLARLCAVYAERRDAALAALDKQMPSGTAWTRPAGGFFIWITLPAGSSAAAVSRRASAAQVRVPAGDSFFAEVSTGQHLRLAFSYLSPPQIEAGIAVLGRAIAAGDDQGPALAPTPSPIEESQE